MNLLAHHLSVVGVGLLGAGVVFLLIPFIIRFSRKFGLVRGMELHHTHNAAVPRFGGLALALAFVSVEVAILILFPSERARIGGRTTVILSSLAMFAVGFWDDLSPIGAERKLLAQAVIALAVHLAGLGVESLKLPFSGHIVELHGWGVILTVLWLVGITNLLNLIDGVDGLAGGIGLMLMALLVYVGSQIGTFVFLTAGMTGALFAFLFFNFPPARVYLGDGGAYLIGYQIGIFSLISSQKGTVLAALVAPLFVLALPIVDTSLAILRRGLRGLPLFRPDRRHIHHKLLNSGMSRRRVVISLYVVTLVFLVMGFAVFWSRGYLFPVLLGVSVLLLMLCAGRLSFSREWFAVGRTLGNSLALRQEVQYALSLASWLGQEGRRCARIEDLFNDLAFAAGRLGFTFVCLKLPDGQRIWGGEISCDRTKRLCVDLPRFAGGQLEIAAPVCMSRIPCAKEATGTARGLCDGHFDSHLFEILSELLAESFLKASAHFVQGTGSGLRFASPPRKQRIFARGGIHPVPLTSAGGGAVPVRNGGARP